MKLNINMEKLALENKPNLNKNGTDRIVNGAFELEMDFDAGCSAVMDYKSIKSEQTRKCPER